MEYGYHVGSSPTYGKLSVDVLCPAAIPGASWRACVIHRWPLTPLFTQTPR